MVCKRNSSLRAVGAALALAAAASAQAPLSLPVKADGSFDLPPEAELIRNEIRTVAGTGAEGYTGDGGPATAATLAPAHVALDAAGNLYIADPLHLRVRRVDAATGLITTVAGTGAEGYTGDGGPATAATLGIGWDDADVFISVALDAAGNLYIADPGNHVVRRVDAATGSITTVAGTGAEGYSGDGGPATAATLIPAHVALDAAGNLYIADPFHLRVRRVDAATGLITTVAGTGAEGYAGDGGPATDAALAYPTDVALDAAGNLYIADPGNLRVRRVARSSLVVRLPLGSSGEGVYLQISSDGALAWPDGAPVLAGDRVTASNGDTYVLTR